VCLDSKLDLLPLRKQEGNFKLKLLATTFEMWGNFETKLLVAFEMQGDFETKLLMPFEMRAISF
jgi:hypothetical protein